MRRYHLARSVLWLWAIAVISVSFLPGTLAKYSAHGTGSAEAHVAAWSHSPVYGGDASTIIWLRPITGKSSYTINNAVSLNNSGSEVAASFALSAVNASGITFYDGGTHLQVNMSVKSGTALPGSTSNIVSNATFSYGSSSYNGYEDVYFQVTATQID